MRLWRSMLAGIPLLLQGWSNEAQAANSPSSPLLEPELPPAKASNSSQPGPGVFSISFDLPVVTADVGAREASSAGDKASEPAFPDRAVEPLLPVPRGAIPEGDSPRNQLPPAPLPPDVGALFAGAEESLVARAIGHAEGTRTLAGGKTLAYYGHIDPGNQRWNQGTFSYQQAAESPQAADRQQLNRLQQQAQLLYSLALDRGLVLDRVELLNGIDLANQAPAAALDQGYIDWLHKTRGMGLEGQDAILWARVRSFLNPDTHHWNAPGLGNSVQEITRDQARRQQAIAETMALQAEFKEPSSLPVSPTPHRPISAHLLTKENEAIDIILSMDL